MEEDNNRVEHGLLSGLGLNILGDHYDRTNTQDFIDQNAMTRQSEVDGVNDEREISVNQNANTLLPLNTNITQDPDVWALANNIGKCCSLKASSTIVARIGDFLLLTHVNEYVNKAKYRTNTLLLQKIGLRDCFQSNRLFFNLTD